MKTVALISGGKDSCFNMVQCVAEGHQIVALANLKPDNKDELDSYMYQTVGHQAIELYAEAMNLPLYRRTIRGTAISLGRDYSPQDADEVEDLYQLLKEIQSEMDIEAVAVGAILSDYQRVRVEHVCVRLGLTSLAYLWRREQAHLLKEMISCGVDAILIKVAALGLDPDRHLGLTLQQILPHMLKMEKEFGLNVCGEGGEYESFTLDCPLFHKRIVVDEQEVVIHSADAFAPVGYIRLKRLHLEDKQDGRPIAQRVELLPLTTSSQRMELLTAETEGGGCVEDFSPLRVPSLPAILGGTTPSCRVRENYFCVGSLLAAHAGDVESTSCLAMERLAAILDAAGRRMSDVYFMCLYVGNMCHFAAINAVYKTFFGVNPPARICVGTCLPENILFQLDCQGWSQSEKQERSRRTMHVQGISHWAPANIGPYSQATQVDNRVFVAGQIPLVPGTMQLVTGNTSVQCRLSLCHADQVLRAMCPGRCLKDVLLGICYVSHPDVIPAAKRQWDKCWSNEQGDACSSSDNHIVFRPLVEYVVISSLPRGASIEWQVYARSDQVQVREFESEVNDGHVRVISRGLDTAEAVSLFTSTTTAYFATESEEGRCEVATESEKGCFEAGLAVSACLQSYSLLLQAMDRGWADVPLLRVFFPALRFSYASVYAALREELGHWSSSGIPFSLIPVIQLGLKPAIMVVCH